MRRVTLQVKEKTHMMLKLLAVFEGKHLNQITQQALEEFIEKRSETLKELLDTSKNRLTIGIMGVTISYLTAAPHLEIKPVSLAETNPTRHGLYEVNISSQRRDALNASDINATGSTRSSYLSVKPMASHYKSKQTVLSVFNCIRNA